MRVQVNNSDLVVRLRYSGMTKSVRKSSFIAGSFLFSKDSAKYDQTLFLLNCFISLKNVPERHFEEHVFSSWFS